MCLRSGVKVGTLVGLFAVVWALSPSQVAAKDLVHVLDDLDELGEESLQWWVGCYNRGRFDSDYIVDPNGPTGTHATLHGALMLASMSALGDRNNDGEILICVMPGIYTGALFLNGNNFVGSGGSSIPLRMVAPYGPDVTKVEGHQIPTLPAEHAIEIRGRSQGDTEIVLEGLSVSGYNNNASDPSGCPLSAISATNASLTLDKMALKDNCSRTSGGALHVEGVDLVITDSEMVDNSALVSGGAIFAGVLEGKVTRDTAAEITDTRFITNTAHSGGAICVAADMSLRMDIEGSTFTNNLAVGVDPGGEDDPSEVPGGRGGAILGWGIDIEETVFEGNHATLSGGAIHGGELDVVASSFQNNGVRIPGEDETLTPEGGALYLIVRANACSNSTSISETEFDGNRAQWKGGAIHAAALLSTLNLDIVDSHFTFNIAIWGDGGAIWSEAVALDISASEDGASNFSDNSAPYPDPVFGGKGGAIYLEDGVADIHGPVSFSDNHAGLHGGAVYAGEHGISMLPNLSIDGASFTGNDTFIGSGRGGGILVHGGYTKLSGVTLANNSSGTGGGLAIFTQTLFDVVVEIQGGAVDANSAGFRGGGIGCHNDNPGLTTVQLDIDPMADIPTFITNNTADGSPVRSGGGISLSGCDATLVEASISGNSCDLGLGGGVWMGTDSTLDAFDVSISDNTAASGGGLSVNSGSQASFLGQSNALSGNTATLRGGGVTCQSDLTGTSALSAQNLTLSNNTATEGGGLAGRRCEIRHEGGGYIGNIVQGGAGQGGGVLLDGGNVALIGLEIADNGATGEGSGLYMTHDQPQTASLSIENVLVTGNEGAQGALLVDALSHVDVFLAFSTIAGNRNTRQSLDPANAGLVFIGDVYGLLNSVAIAYNHLEPQFVTLEGGGVTPSCDVIASAFYSDFGLSVEFPVSNHPEIFIEPGFIGIFAGTSPHTTIPGLGYDYHLMPESKLIDAGDPNALDADGSPADIGAFGGPGGGWSCTTGC